MLNTDPAQMMQEVRRAEQLRKRFLANTAALTKRYAGNWYRTDARTKARPENMLFSYVATLLPAIVFDNPGATVSAKRAVSHKPIADAVETAVNTWVKDVDLRTELEAVAVDMLVGFGCMKVLIEPRGDYSADQAGGVDEHFAMTALHPAAVRVSPANVVIDPDAESHHRARFVGHMFQRDLSSLQGDERYDQAVVAKLTADDEKREGRSAGERAFAGGAGAEGPLRGRVTLYELYLPESRQIGTIALNLEGTGEWVRPLRAYHGPKLGPYVFFGVFLVPGQVYPLSPLAAIAEQDDELNAHAVAAAKEAASAKNLTLVDSNNPELATAIEQAPMNGIVKVKGLNANGVVQVAMGGTTPQRLAYLQTLLERTDRVGGQSDAARGKAAGVTATEAAMAGSNADARTAFIDLKFRDAVRHVLSRAAWYIFHDEGVVLEVNGVDPQTGQPFEGVYLGGQQDGQDGASWEQFSLEIEPLSMRRVDPMLQQQQAMAAQTAVVELAPLVMSMPYINWPAVFDLVGQAANLPNFAKTIFNQQGLALLSAGAMGGMMPGGPMGGGGGPLENGGGPPGLPAPGGATPPSAFAGGPPPGPTGGSGPGAGRPPGPAGGAGGGFGRSTPPSP